jgi:D-alanyl-D-alanine carboxypeptidase/D-alanyl-D-alanine-endopeptidase (penicillin-binding protein 4)
MEDWASITMGRRALPGTGRRWCLLLLAAWGFLTAAAPRVASSPASLDDRVAAVLSASALARARVGVHVVALGSGRVIYSRNGTDRFVVASNEKLVTAAAALDALGETYEFVTSLRGGGPIESGVLRGDLVVRGGGDPTFGGSHGDEDATAIFRRWARVLKAKGLVRVAGDVVADDTFFDRVFYHPHWSKGQAWKWYFPTTSAFSINDNCVVVTVSPGSARGKAAVVQIEPADAPVQVLNLCKTDPRRQTVWFDRQLGSDTIRVGGYVRLGARPYSGEVTVPDPAFYAAVLLKSALEQEGIAVDGRARVVAEGQKPAGQGVEPLCERRAALVPVLRTMLKFSHNHYAEQVIKTVGAEASGVGSWETGLARGAQFLERLGFKDSEFDLADGSGLSRYNRLTPALLAGLLAHMAESEHGAAFRSLLAVPGEDGTLNNRLSAEPYRSSVVAKTGYVNGAGALSGYARTRAGVEVAFCIFVNDQPGSLGSYSKRQVLDAICRAIVDEAG